MIKKCREKTPIFNYIQYDGTNAEECSKLNRLSLSVWDGKLYQTGVLDPLGGSIVDIDSYIVVDGGSGIGIFTEEQFCEIFENVEDLTEALQPLPESNTPVRFTEG